jgi:hypothetical protein
MPEGEKSNAKPAATPASQTTPADKERVTPAKFTNTTIVMQVRNYSDKTKATPPKTKKD